MSPRRVLLIRRRRPIGEPADARSGGARILDALRALGWDLASPDVNLTTWLLPSVPEAPPPALEPRDRPFDVVVLGSHLINTPDDARRKALLDTLRRSIGPAGMALLEHHPLDWLDTAAESWSERDGQRLGMVDVRVEPPFVSAVSVYEAHGASIRQPFIARVLSDAELDQALARASLQRTRRLGPTWIGATPGAGNPFA